jgi:hypothetical protein
LRLGIGLYCEVQPLYPVAFDKKYVSELSVSALYRPCNIDLQVQAARRVFPGQKHAMVNVAVQPNFDTFPWEDLI